MIIELASEILFWIVAGLLWWLWQLYRDYNVDRTRQRLFAVRDELFLQAAAGDIPMDSEAHRITRKLANGSIRFCHRLSFTHVFMLLRAEKGGKLRNNNETAKNIAEAVKSLPADQRKIVLRAINEINSILLNHIAKGNLVVFLLSEVLFICSRLGLFKVMSDLKKTVFTKTKHIQRLLESEALKGEACLVS